MNLIINWTSPIPYPSNDFQIDYRRNYDPAYTGFNTSGTTSGSAYLINVSAPACYEGYIKSHCNPLENFSDAVPFGVNAYQPIHATVTISGNTVTGMGTSVYANPYNTLVNITVLYTISSVPNSYIATVQYPAGVTSYTLFQAVIPGVVLTGFTINSMIGSFDNGGELQQYDSVNTPSYFKFYWDENTSGTTWNGSPIVLPSFVQQAFNVTAVDPSNNPVAGNILVSWIADSIYQNGVSPYNEIIFKVYDPDTSLMGTVTAFPLTLGLQTLTIPITKVSADISTETEFTMITQWGDTTQSASVPFYLPNF